MAIAKSAVNTEEFTEVISTASPIVKIPEENKVEKNLLIRIKPERVDNPNGNLKVLIKAPMFEEYFKNSCPDKEVLESKDPDYPKYCLAMAKAKKPDGSPIYLRRINQAIPDMKGKYSDGFLMSDFVTPNMTLLTAIGLSEGVEFVFSDMYTKDSIEHGVNGFYKNAKKIFKDFIKPMVMEFEVYVREIS